MPKDTFPAAGSGLPSSSPRIPAGKSVTILSERRGFLRALAGLPFIGGGVTLIGHPTAVAEPITDDLLYEYSDWLGWERFRICQEIYGGEMGRRQEHVLSLYSQARYWHFGEIEAPAASTRAALVLSAVGCDWRRRPDV